ncbi:MAG: hypothetical protein LC731_03505, partial [Acidobacteria bacterium]|nr:hypothetical protein [Acidobacteriota bacterium]
LLMTVPTGNAFTQDTYLIEHEALGAFYLFLVPVGQQGKGPQDCYEAVIYRAVQQDEWSGSVPVTEKETNPASAPAPQARATEGLALADSAGRRKTEQDVFYFQPQKLKSPADSKPKEEPGAAGRLAASRLTFSEAPDIAGLRLGMTIDEVLALFPGIRDDAKVRSSLSRPPSKFGVQGLAINPSKYDAQWELDGITQISFTFMDGLVSSLYVNYNNPVWEHVDEFVAKFSGEKGLPEADSWDAYVGMDTQLKTLKCGGFEVSLFAGGKNVLFNYVQLTDTAAHQRLKERKAKARKSKGAGS